MAGNGGVSRAGGSEPARPRWYGAGYPRHLRWLRSLRLRHRQVWESRRTKPTAGRSGLPAPVVVGGEMARVAVLNAGGWGTALASVLAARGHAVTLWARRPELATELAVRRENPAYLPGVRLPASVTPTADLATALADCRVVLFV